MPIVAADLKKYACASRPEDDVSTSGGAAATSVIAEVTQMGSTTTLEALSDNSGDTMNLTIHGRDAPGEIVNEVRALTGLTPVVFSTNTLERFLKAVLASAPTGNVTIRHSSGGATVAVIPAGKTGATILFIDSTSESAQTIRYEKEAWKNEHATLTLTNAQTQLTADPSSSVRVGVALAKDDSVTVSNRKTAPGSVTFVDDSVLQSVPGSQLEAGSYIGLWIEMTRAADAAPIKTSYTTQISGNTT